MSIPWDSDRHLRWWSIGLMIVVVLWAGVAMTILEPYPIWAIPQLLTALVVASLADYVMTDRDGEADEGD